MEGFEGIISLFIACVEIVLLINLLIFSEKNKLNKLSILFVTLLFVYQVIEFFICYAELKSSFMIYLAFLDISFLPPLGLIIVLEFSGYKSVFNKLLFLPPLFFAFYYPVILNEFMVEKCTVLYAVFNYPLGTLYGLFYYLPIIVTIILLFLNRKKLKDGRKRKLNIILLNGYLFTFVPVVLGVIFSSFFVSAIESLFCKIAIVLAIAFTIFVLKNKTEVKKEKI